MLYSSHWPNDIVSLTLLLEVSSNMCTINVCYLLYKIINFKIKLSFSIIPFYQKKLNILRTKRAAWKKRHSSSFLTFFVSWETNFKNIYFIEHLRIAGSDYLKKQPTEMFCKKGVLRNFTKSTGKQLCQSLFFNKVADLRPEV